jgi:hypothetical protein
MSQPQFYTIVHPEPHYRGPNLGTAWGFLPRWYRILLTIMFIVAAALVAIFVKP